MCTIECSRDHGVNLKPNCTRQIEESRAKCRGPNFALRSVRIARESGSNAALRSTEIQQRIRFTLPVGLSRTAMGKPMRVEIPSHRHGSGVVSDLPGGWSRRWGNEV